MMLEIHNLHHLAQVWLTPPVNIWIFVIIGLLFLRRRRIMFMCWFMGVVITYAQYTPLFAQSLTNLIYPKLDRSYNILHITPQAIVVLGAGVTVDIGPFGEFKAYPGGMSLLNVQAAAEVAMENPSLPLILSGGVTDGYYSEAAAMNDYLRENYHLVNISILESQSLNTNENAKYTALKLNEIGVKRVILVTQASHMWRSLALFNKYKIASIAYPAWDNYSIEGLSWWQKLLPKRSAAVQTQKIFHEMIGYFVYIVM